MSVTYTPSWSPFIEVELFGKEWRLERAADMESLWDSMTDFSDDDGDERLPYWVELWPSSLVLAEYLYKKQEKIAGKVCLDVGCGLGLTALVATWLGASVLAFDYEYDALLYAKKNEKHNAFIEKSRTFPPTWLLMDWRFPAVKARSIERIWGGDIMYEKIFAEPLLRFFSYALAEGGTVWIAEPTRCVYDSFRAKLFDYGFWGRCVYESKIEPLISQKSKVPVRLWELQRL